MTVRAGGRTSAFVAAIRRDGFAGADPRRAAKLAGRRACYAGDDRGGQVIAPIVFEAAEDAKTAVGMATVAGLSRFGDRKETLEFVAGVSPPGPGFERIAIAGAMIWPPSATAPAVAPARVVNGFVVAVRGEPAPLTIDRDA